MTVTDIGFLTAFWGGFSSFFSIWQLCLMQITPFFLAFAVGLYLLQNGSRPLTSLISACTGYILGFSIVFALMGTSGMGAAGYILYNIEDFRTAAGVYAIIIAALTTTYTIFGLRIKHRILFVPVGLLLGAAFAIAYSPCIPPIMSQIMNFASKPANAHRGFHLLVVYGFGLTLAYAVSGTVLALATGFFAGDKTRNKIIYASSAVLLIMAVLLFTDLMVRYKSILVGAILD